MKHAAVGGGREETSTKRKYDIPQSIQPCWFQDEWNKQLVCLNDWARDLFQWLVQPLSNNNIFIKWMEANDSNISSKITLLASYLKFLVHWQHEQASSCHLYHQCNTNEEPIIPYSKSVTMCQTKKKNYVFMKQTRFPFASSTLMRSSTGTKPRCVTTSICRNM